ncbi:MAG: hypothetical protein ACPGWR_29905 [Ardenticatenaceae bacterium]
MEQQIISSWSEMELIENVAHELRQSTTSALGWANVLVTGDFGFTSHQQQLLLEKLLCKIEEIHEINHLLNIWYTSNTSSLMVPTCPNEPSQSRKSQRKILADSCQASQIIWF